MRDTDSYHIASCSVTWHASFKDPHALTPDGDVMGSIVFRVVFSTFCEELCVVRRKLHAGEKHVVAYICKFGHIR